MPLATGRETQESPINSERSSYCNYVWTEQDGLSVSGGLLACRQQRTWWEKLWAERHDR
ncbi:hypothetical protein E3U43_022870 [Larimichthys crocea]|uniref:Uncharacterized protein n=1 Tax=Larimichthys crocea TaxID=215358 RepID=A0ACD3R4R9_LARCR|nr:hypothetical protein E3U43_022870 [Larimichthys crocea]